MNVAWGTDGVDEDHGTPVAAGAVPEDRTAHGPPAEASVQASVYSTLTSSKSQKARRSAVLAFEREMQQFSDQVCEHQWHNIHSYRRGHHGPSHVTVSNLLCVIQTSMMLHHNLQVCFMSPYLSTRSPARLAQRCCRCFSTGCHSAG